MRSTRDVFLTIGKSTYAIQTALENDELDRIKSLIDEACGEIVKGAQQEDLLMITCLRLAYSLDVVNNKIKTILDKLEA